MTWVNHKATVGAYIYAHDRLRVDHTLTNIHHLNTGRQTLRLYTDGGVMAPERGKSQDLTTDTYWLKKGPTPSRHEEMSSLT